jgi:hypothetical protein
MATVKWGASPTSRGTVLTTELGNGAGLADATFSAAGPAYDNTANLDRWGWLEFVTGAAITPAAGGTILIYMVHSPGGTNYSDVPTANNPGTHTLVAMFPLTSGASATQRAIHTVPFAMPPGKVKFILKNQAGVSLANTGNTVTLYTANESVA